jgi:hypothetical protein
MFLKTLEWLEIPRIVGIGEFSGRPENGWK